MKEIKVFVSYSKKDKTFLFKEGGLLEYLKLSLEADGVKFWTDQMLVTADDWDSVIQKKIQESHIALVLVSQWFLNTPYCTEKEVNEFLQKSKKDGLKIFPIIVGACEWENYEWLKSRQFLPKGGENLRRNYINRGKREELFLRILKDLRIQIDQIRSSPLTPNSKPTEEIYQEPPRIISNYSPEHGNLQLLIQLDLDEIIKQASYTSIIGVSTDKVWLFTFLANRILHLWALDDFSRHIVVNPTSSDGAPSSCAMRKGKNGSWELLIGLDNKIECWHIFPDGSTKYLNQMNFKTKFKNLVQLKYSHDTMFLLITYLDGIDVWDMNTETNLRHYPCMEQLCTSSFYSNDQFVVAGSKNGTIYLWEMATGSLVGEFHDHNDMQISSLIDSSSGFMSAGEDGSLIIRKGSEGIKSTSIQFSSPIQCMDFDKTSGLIYAGLSDKTILARNLISTINNWEKGLPDILTALTHIDGSYLFAANEGRTIEILDLKSGQKLATLVGFRANSWLAISVDGEMVGEGYEQFVGQGKQKINPVKKFGLPLARKADQHDIVERS